jgi:molecular chaperone GrpE
MTQEELAEKAKRSPVPIFIALDLLAEFCYFIWYNLSYFLKNKYLGREMSIQQTNTAENDELEKNAQAEPSDEAVNPDLAGKSGDEPESAPQPSLKGVEPEVRGSPLAPQPSLKGEGSPLDSGLGEASDDDGLAELVEELDSLDPDKILADSNKKTNENSKNQPHQNDKITELEAKAVELSAQLDEMRDQLLRKTADFDNYRKRMNQEKQKAIDFANESLLLDIIPIMDDFERAIQSAETSEELKGLPAGKAMLDGITMIEKQLVSKLENKWGLKRFNSAGEAFDPNLHEAMLMEKSPDIQEPVVQEDFIKGYMLKDRVIRAAKVKVLMPEDGSGN